MNIIPFLESFIREWLRSNPLLVYELFDEKNQFDLKIIIDKFLKRKNLAGKIDL